MKTIELSTVWPPSSTLTNRGPARSTASKQVVKAKNLTVFTTGLLLALTLAGSAQALTWDIDTVDSTGAAGEFSSIALDANGDLHISYYDRTTGSLKYAQKLLPHVWGTETVDSEGTVAGQHTALALDSSGVPHISYYANGSLKYARKLSAGNWSTETIDSGGWYTSIAVDSSGNPHISYFDLTSETVKYARKLSPGNWSVETLGAAGAFGGYTSIALDSSAYPHISYLSLDHHNGFAWLKYARKSCARVITRTGAHLVYCSWSSEKLYPEADPVHTSIALDSSGLPHISYAAGSSLQYRRKLTSGSWDGETVDPLPGVAEASFASMALDSSGVPHISYVADNIGLRYARRLSSWNWSLETVGAEGRVLHTSIAVDSSGNPHISYFDRDEVSTLTIGELRYANGQPQLIKLP